MRERERKRERERERESEREREKERKREGLIVFYRSRRSCVYLRYCPRV